MKYTYKEFKQEFESHLGGFGVNTLFYYFAFMSGYKKIVKVTETEVLSWSFKTDIELMDIGSELFKENIFNNPDFYFTTKDVLNELIGNVLKVKENDNTIGYLVKDN